MLYSVWSTIDPTLIWMNLSSALSIHSEMDPIFPFTEATLSSYSLYHLKAASPINVGDKALVTEDQVRAITEKVLHLLLSALRSDHR